MRVGIMGALRAEVDAIKPLMVNISDEIDYQGVKLHTGKIGEYDVVLILPPDIWGPINAAMITSLMTNEDSKYRVNQLIFTGVAGAVASHPRIGDIVVADTTHQHDYDARPAVQEKCTMPMKNIKFFRATQALVDRAKIACETFLQNMEQLLPPHLLKQFDLSSTKNKCLIGPIATGSSFVSTEVAKAEILAHTPDTLAAEMEGVAIAFVAENLKTNPPVQCVIIRTISDIGDHGVFVQFIQEAAGLYSRHIVDYMLNPRVGRSI